MSIYTARVIHADGHTVSSFYTFNSRKDARQCAYDNCYPEVPSKVVVYLYRSKSRQLKRFWHKQGFKSKNGEIY